MATLTHSNITLNAQHNKHSQAAIEAVASALKTNAEALSVLAATIQVDMRDSCAVKIVGDDE